MSDGARPTPSAPDASTPASPANDPTRRRGGCLRLLALQLGLLVVLVLLVEVGLRFAGWSPSERLRWSEHPELHYTATPNQSGDVLIDHRGAGGGTIAMQINRYGQRGPDYPLAKPADERRVIVLGDSLTFGPGVDTDDTFVAVAQRELDTTASGARHTRLVNAGANGWSTAHYLLWMQTQLERFDPDAVVVDLFIGNDMIIATRHQLLNPVPWPGVVRNSAIGRYLLDEHRRTLVDLALFLGADAERERLAEPSLAPELRQYVDRFEADLDYQDKLTLWQHALEHLARMKELADAAGVEFLCVLIPQEHMLSAAKEPPLLSWVATRVEQLGVPVVRPDEPLRAAGREAWHDYDAGHFNAAGHAVMGRVLADALREHGLAD